MVATVRTLPRVNAEEKSFLRFVVEEEGPNLYGPCLLQHLLQSMINLLWQSNL